MAILASNIMTYADWAKRLDPDGNTAEIVELLSQANEVLDDMLVMEGNLPTGHQSTVRTGLPASVWRYYNTGIPASKSTTAQITDTCANLQALSNIDRDVLELNGNSASFRLQEDASFLESLKQTMASTVFYGNSASNPERFLGFAPRYSTVNPANAASAANVIDAGGTGSTNASIWIVNWGSSTMHGIFPKGKKAGLQMIDQGEDWAFDANQNRYRAFFTEFKWEVGLAVRDWRYAVRIANIDVSMLSGANAAALINLLVRGIARFPTMKGKAATTTSSDAPRGLLGGRPAIYCNRDIRTALDLQALNKTNVLLQMQEFNGEPVLMFRGIPIRTVDALLSTEARVV